MSVTESCEIKRKAAFLQILTFLTKYGENHIKKDNIEGEEKSKNECSQKILFKKSKNKMKKHCF